MRPPLQLHQESPGFKKTGQMSAQTTPVFALMGPYLLHVSYGRKTQEGSKKAMGLFLVKQLPMTDMLASSY